MKEMTAGLKSLKIHKGFEVTPICKNEKLTANWG